jgi:hypothetical protein
VDCIEICTPDGESIVADAEAYAATVPVSVSPVLVAAGGSDGLEQLANAIANNRKRSPRKRTPVMPIALHVIARSPGGTTKQSVEITLALNGLLRRELLRFAPQFPSRNDVLNIGVIL